MYACACIYTEGLTTYTNTPRSDAREFEHLLRRPVRVQAQLLHIRLPDVEDARLHVADRLYFASGGELRYSHIHTCIGSLCVYINVFLYFAILFLVFYVYVIARFAKYSKQDIDNKSS